MMTTKHTRPSPAPEGQKWVRDWTCRCGRQYTAEVILSDGTTNLSGEQTAWCPKCLKKPLAGTPAYLVAKDTT